MIKKMIKILSFTLILNAFFSYNALAGDFFTLNNDKNTVIQSVDSFSNLLDSGTFSVKRGQSYDESKDTAIKSRSGGPEQTSPEHGYFAVPLIVIGLAGILLYFSKFD